MATMRFFTDHWKQDLWSTFIAIALFFIAVMPTINFYHYIMSKVDPIQIEQDVFVARVHVPNFTEGENPLVEYDNTKHVDFRAFYKVEVKTRQGVTVCIGSNRPRGRTDYDTEDVLDPNITTFGWFVDTLIDPKAVRGKTCDQVIKSGEYYTSWRFDILLDDGTELIYRPPNSNVFTVYPKPLDPLMRR